MGEAAAALRTEGVEAFNRGAFRKAVVCLTRVLLDAAEDHTARFYLGASHYHLGRIDEATRCLEPLKDMASLADVRSAAVPEYLARCALALKRPEALEYARGAVARDASDPCAQLVLGHALMRVGRHADALDAYENAWQREGGRQGRACLSFDCAQVPLARAAALTSLHRFDAALQALDDAEIRHPGRAATANQRGLILLQAHRPLDAVSAFQEALRRRPRSRTLRARIEHNLVCAKQASQRRDPKFSDLPVVTFADVGGLAQQKHDIRRIVETIHRDAALVRQYGVVRNGLLLHGPSGCGKTLLARAVAGELGLGFLFVSATELRGCQAAGAVDALAGLFTLARERTPCVLFFEALDHLAASTSQGPNEAHVSSVLARHLDACRHVPGLILMAATNRLEAIDPDVIREGRFDYRIEVPRPDHAARGEVLRALVAGRPVEPGLDWDRLASRTDTCSSTQLRAIVDDAAEMAFDARQRIGDDHLQTAIRRMQESHRYRGPRLSWDDLVLSSELLERLRFIEGAIENRELANQLGVSRPTAVLLSGPPGTGKKCIVRALATQTDANFFTVTPADLHSKRPGGAEQQLRAIFERARTHAPAILFFDEIERVLGYRSEPVAREEHERTALLDAFLRELDLAETRARILVIASTHRPELVDDAVRRCDRFGEHIQLTLPDSGQRLALLRLFARTMSVAGDVDVSRFVDATEGATGADLRWLCTQAGRVAFARELRERDGQVCVQQGDFEVALAQWAPAAASSVIGFRPRQRTAS